EAGNDILFATADDGIVDRLDCGRGRDTAMVRRGDIARNCERVVTVTETDPREP
ncbi:MAG: hypothetical protein JWM25_97, partial [Thermoleophilia bacterium]|nr:hypothetical protein [Thermoleophilia bacterium]